MNIIHKYIFKQTAWAVICTVGLFVFVLVAGNAMREEVGLLTSGRVSWAMFFWLLAMLVPYVAAYALPLGLLAGVLLVLGRLSAQREITAMRAAGMSIRQITAPIILVALAGIVGSLFINFYYSPIARTAYKSHIDNLLRTNPIEFIKPRVFIKEFPGLILYVGEREGGQLKDFWIWELDDHKRVIRFIRAEEGTFEYDEPSDAVILSFSEGAGELRRQADPEDFKDTALLTPTYENFTIRIPMETVLGNENVHRKLSMLTLNELIALRDKGAKMQAEGRPEGKQEKIKAQMQIQEHFAMAFASLSLAFIAIPLGIKVSRSETFANLGIALGLGLVYYLSMGCIGWMEDHPNWRPDLLIWLPNIMFQLLALYLMRRLLR